ncbi:hypothetical protein [Vibrio navarrensis]|uniref:hypothetical protein n=1 Tax=Vibrio navarrensis TaxID=29495 RepID=UPI00051E1090|nr:hypothetical protein [Vibrio navarrensis]KGK21003.1 hypothetical protein EA25_07030 [Vibrio navarrensis]
MKGKNKYLYFLTILFAVLGCTEEKNEQSAENELRSETVMVNVQEPTPEPQNLSPEEVATKYIDARLRAGGNGRSKETYHFLSSEDKEVTSEDEYLSNSLLSERDISNELISAITQKVSYTIEHSVIENETAEVTVKVTAPVLPPAIRKSLLDENSKNVEKEAIAYLQSPALQFDTGLEHIKMVKEPEGWRVFLDFATSKKIDLLVEEAEALTPHMGMLLNIDGYELETMKPKLLLAQAKYKEALSLGSSFIAESHLESLEKQIKKLNFYEQNKDQIQVKNITVEEGRHGDKGIFGEVKNNGDIALRKVEIIIYLLDKEGNPVHEISYHPVLVTDLSYGNDAVPLKPNYSRKFGVKADDAPLEWSQKVRVIISDIEGIEGN